MLRTVTDPPEVRSHAEPGNESDLADRRLESLRHTGE
jgi:hypothetical protein